MGGYVTPVRIRAWIILILKTGGCMFAKQVTGRFFGRKGSFPKVMTILKMDDKSYKVAVGLDDACKEVIEHLIPKFDKSIREFPVLDSKGDKVAIGVFDPFTAVGKRGVVFKDMVTIHPLNAPVTFPTYDDKGNRTGTGYGEASYREYPLYAIPTEAIG
jgi:hypothetical protein